jgi:hypothetical protein
LNTKVDKKPKSTITKPEKESTHKVRKKGGMIFLRVLLWGFISFIFIQGVIVSVRPDTVGEALRVVADFRRELAGVQMLDSEILAFAENFAVEYLTYTAGAESDYHARLSRYSVNLVADSVNNRMNTGSSVSPLYVRAYRREAYSDTQSDVFVVAIVLYTRQGEPIEEDDESVIPLIEEQERVMLKIPVAFNDNRYIVEDLPVFVNDSMTMYDHASTPFAGRELDRNRQGQVFAFLADFFEAYYSERQSIIDNFLAPDAVRGEFRGLDGLLTLERIEDSSRAYHGESSGTLLALVSLTAIDRNGNAMRQNFTVTVIERDGRLYVLRLDTRINNINTGGR